MGEGGCSGLDVFIRASGTCTCRVSVYLPVLFFSQTHTPFEHIHTQIYTYGSLADGAWERKDRALFLDAGAQAQVKTRLAVIPLR